MDAVWVKAGGRPGDRGRGWDARGSGVTGALPGMEHHGQGGAVGSMSLVHKRMHDDVSVRVRVRPGSSGRNYSSPGIRACSSDR